MYNMYKVKNKKSEADELSLLSKPVSAQWTNRTLSVMKVSKYRKISNIRRTKFQNVNVSHLVLQSSLPNPLKPGVKQIMKM